MVGGGKIITMRNPATTAIHVAKSMRRILLVPMLAGCSGVDERVGVGAAVNTWAAEAVS
jgi:hypothetical protein